MKFRSHKLLRSSFSFGGMEIPFRDVRITEECEGCAECMQNCSFKAIYLYSGYQIDHSMCDICGDCYTVCPADAIEVISG